MATEAKGTFGLQKDHYLPDGAHATIQENVKVMPVPKFKYENLHLFIIGALAWLTLAYVAADLIVRAISYSLSLLNQFFHSQNP